MTYPFPQVVDSSMRSEFVSCPQSFYRSYIQRIRPAGESIHLVAGGAMAKGLEIARRAFHSFVCDEEEAIRDGLKALLKDYTLTHQESDRKTLDRVVEAYVGYFDKWPLASDYIQPALLGGKPCIEFTFSIPLPISNPSTGMPILIAGRADMIGVYKEQSFILDEKTCSQLGPSWPYQWDLRGQFACYTWAAREHGYSVAGSIVRGIKLTKTVIDYAEAYCLQPEWKVTRWYEQFLRDVERMISCWKTNTWDWNLSESCNSFGGCKFKDLCLAQDPEMWIEGRYVENTWSPLHNLGGEEI